MYILTDVHTNQFHLKLYEIEEAHFAIRWIAKRDTLLSLDAVPSRGGFLMHSYIKGRGLDSPPFIKTSLTSLTSIHVHYNASSSRLELKFVYRNGEISPPHKYRVRNFQYDTIVGIGVKLGLCEHDHSERHALQHFAEECTSLDSFRSIIPTLDKTEELGRYLQEATRHTHTSRTLLKENLSSVIDSTMQKTSSKTPTRIKGVTIYRPSAPKCIYSLSPNGTYTRSDTPSSDEPNTWYTWSEGDTQHFILFNQYRRQHHIILQGGNLLDRHETWEADPNISAYLLTRESTYRLIVLIICCRHRLGRVKVACRTWLRVLHRLGILCLVVIGGADKAMVDGNLLYVKSPDTYEALPHKVFDAYTYCLQHYEFEHIYKVDDDTLVNPLKLVSIPLDGYDYVGKGHTVDTQFNRFWHRGKCKITHLNRLPYPASRIQLGVRYAKGETGYFLSCRAVQLLQRHASWIRSDLYEDKVIGDVLTKEGVELYEHPAYQTKRYEIFPKHHRLDQYTVIVDAGEPTESLYPGHFMDVLDQV